MEELKPIVKSPTKRRSREGRGFSLGELKAVGLSFKKAKKLGIPIDTRRRSAHEENVEKLRKLLSEGKGGS